MTTTLFEHTVIPQNSSTSPVENLATEVSDAFALTESIISTDASMIPNFAKVIGNFLLASIKQHGFSQSFTETVTVSADKQAFPLQAVPSAITSVSYYDSLTSTTIYLTPKTSSQAFDNVDQFKVIGKNVYISGGASAARTFQVAYDGLIPLLGGLTGYSNILVNETSPTYLIAPVIVGTAVSLVYDFDVQAKITELFKTGLNANYVYAIGQTTTGSFVTIPYTSMSISTDTLTFDTTYDLSDVTEIAIFSININISDFITAFYTDYISHQHGASEAVRGVDHSDLLNNYTDSDSIIYKDVDIKNYQHPQFINREGYNPNTPEVYNNGILGDLFFTALVTSVDQVYKTLSKDSNGIIFGDPTSGSKLFYSHTEQALTIQAGADLNGLNINFNPGNAGISLNNVAYILEDSDRTSIIGKNNKVDIRTADSTFATLYTDSFIARQASQFLVGLTSNKITLGSINFIPVGNTLQVSTTDTTLPMPERVDFQIPITGIKVTADTLEADLYNFVDGSKIQISPTNTLNSVDGHFEFDTTTSVDFLSTGAGTGIKVGRDLDNSLNLYNSSFTGQAAVGSDSDFYVEVPPSQSVYLLQSTTNPITVQGVTYTFRDTVDGMTTVNSLKEWPQADIYARGFTGTSLKVAESDAVSKNGIMVGPFTRISSVGSGEDCPEGLTIIESKGAVAFVAPLSTTASSCTGVSYQDCNMGNIQAFGKISADDSIYSIGNITSGDTIIASAASIENQLQTSTLLVTSDASFNGPVEFLNAVTIGNTLSVTGSVDITGALEATSVAIDKVLTVGGLLSVAGQAIFSTNVTIEGSLYTVSGFTTTGPISSDSLSTGPIVAGNITANGGADITGDTNLNGTFTLSGNSTIRGNMDLSGNIQVSADITTDTLYVIDDVTVGGRLLASGNTTLVGASIVLGTASSTTQINGTLQLNNSVTTMTGDLLVIGTSSTIGSSSVGGALTVNGQITAATGLNVGTNLTVGGTVSTAGIAASGMSNMTGGINVTSGATIDTANITDLKAKSADVETLFVDNSLQMGSGSTLQTDTLQTNSINQGDPNGTSTFNGVVNLTNQLNTTGNIVIGNPSIQTTRNTAGIYLSSNEIRMGNNSVIEAVQVFAAKGYPGNSDLSTQGGYAFQSSNGLAVSDGDTGMFASIGSGGGTMGSDLSFIVDSVFMGSFYYGTTATGNITFGPVEGPYTATLTNPAKAKSIVTLDMLLDTIVSLQSEMTLLRINAAETAWPLGSVYFNAVNSLPPSDPSLLGFGTWLPYAPGRSLIGLTGSTVGGGGFGTISGGLVAPSDFATNILGTAYGEFKHTLTIPEMPSHTHPYTASGPAIGGKFATSSSHASFDSQPSAPAGGDQPHNNVHPVIVTAMWQRVA